MFKVGDKAVVLHESKGHEGDVCQKDIIVTITQADILGHYSYIARTKSGKKWFFRKKELAPIGKLTDVIYKD